MPRLDREYPEHRFDADTVRSAYALFKRFVVGQVPEERSSKVLVDGAWQQLSEAQDFFDAYTSDAQSAELAVSYKTSLFRFSLDSGGTRVAIGLAGEGEARQVLQVFQSALSTKTRRSVFLGHGRDPVWTRLFAHLESQPDLRIRTYENSIGPGVTAIELLEQLGSEVDFAVLVHTCDDQSHENSSSPSANVVHETGFFQGRLGRHRTVVVRERGCPTFHNIGGLHEVTFDPDAIEETHEQVLQLIRGASPK